MDKIVSFGKGIRRQPSIGEDGELSELVNLVPINGELVNVREMGYADAPTLLPTEKLIATHDVGSQVHYIALGAAFQGSTIITYYAYSENEKKWVSNRLGSIPTESSHVNVSIVGYTIILSWENGRYYYMWKDGEYKALGARIPELPISFGLQGTAVRSDTIEYKPSNGMTYQGEEQDAATNPYGTFYYAYFKDADKNEVNNHFHGRVASFIREYSQEKGRFMYPFFVRYAYRMYDGSLTMHSAPILMVCSTKCAPVAVVEEFINKSEKDWHADGINYRIIGVTHDLDYMPMGDTSVLENWKDIVRSVDIFVSSPIYTYDPNGEVDMKIEDDESYGTDCYAICKHMNYNTHYSEETYPKQYQKKGFAIIESMSFGSNFKRNDRFIKFPSKGIDDVNTLIKESSLFYHIDTIPLDKIMTTTSRTKIELKEDVLKNLETREVMSDDYGSHDDVYGKSLFTYNNRLAISNITKMPFAGYDADSCFTHTDGYVNFVKEGQGITPTGNNKESTIYYIVKIKEEGDIRTVGGAITSGEIGNHTYNPLLYFFYPNPNAYEAIFYADNGYPLQGYYKISLTPHPLLHGAYYFAGFEGNGICSEKNKLTSNVTMTASDKPIALKNYLYIADSSNPFVFAAANVTQVGLGEILKLSTSAKALSQGQFGQFPLYAFCTDGIWALEVASDGSYSARQPISRDVCNNPDSITQIDGAVVFTTDQGLKMIQGSEVVLLSGAMDGHNVDELTYFKEGFFATHKTSEYDGLEEYDKLVVQETRDFRQILAKCKIAYDYPNQLLRIFPKEVSDKTYKYYVYSFNSREFASVIGEGEVKSIVSGYPSSLLQIGTSIYTFDAAISEGLKRGLLLTRPIDMGEPFALKKLQDMRMHYTKYAEGSKCSMVVYVSNDGVKWFVLPSLRKCSFKFYRIAIITHLSDDDRLSGLVMRYEVERTNKLR